MSGGIEDETSLLRAIVESIPTAFAYWTPELRCRFANRPYADWVGKEPCALVGRHVRDIIGEALFAQVEPLVRTALAGEATRIERVVHSAKGTTLTILARYLPHIVDGKVVGLLSFIEDVSEARHAVAAVEERFEKAFRLGPNAFVMRRIADDVIVDVNDQFAATTGFAREEVIGRTPREVGFESPLRRKLHEAPHFYDAPRSELRNIEIPFLTKSGETRVALGSVEIIDTAIDGRCAFSSFVDITDRLLARRRLAVQHAVSRVLAESHTLAEAGPRVLQIVCEAEKWSVGAIWEVDVEADVLRCVAAFHAAGLERGEELEAATRAMVFTKGQGADGRVWETGEPLSIPDVSKVPGCVRTALFGSASVLAFPIRRGERVLGVIDFMGSVGASDPQLHELVGAIGGQLALFIERTRAAETVRRSEERLKSVIESLSEGLLVAGPDARTVQRNPAAIALLGLDDPTNASFSVEKFADTFELRTLDDEVLAFADWPLTRVMRGEVVRNVEVVARRRDIPWQRIMAFSGRPVTQPDGTTLGILTFVDIGDRIEREAERRAAEHLAEDNRRVHEASRLKSQFLANMSHELRTPLNAIIGFTALMHGGKVGPLTDTQHEYLGDVLTSGKHLLQLINDVLDLAKIESGRVEIVVGDVDLMRVMGEVRAVVRGLATDKRIPLGVDIDPSVARVSADERLVKQILYNLVSNAIKFTPSEGKVSIRVRPEDATTFRIEVEDTGIGISEEDMKRLFVEFQQLDASAGKRHQGTGLGLALTRKLAEAQGGTAGATSALGKGSTFYVILPRQVASSASS